jgi:hypothetical protein
MRISDVGFSRMTTFTKITGAQFRGDIVGSGSAVGDTALTAPFLVLETRANAQVAAGDVFKGPDGKQYLVAERANRFHVEEFTKTFNIVPLNTYATWTQYGSVVDAVTGLKGDPTYVAHPTTPNIWVFLEASGVVDDSLQAGVNTYRLITGYPVLSKDKINGLTVQSVVRYLGVNVATVK